VFRKGLHIVFVASVYLLLIFGTTAREFLHNAFADHHDTVHRYHAPGEYSFESEHHHCEFPNYSIPDLHSEISFPYIVLVERPQHQQYQTHDVQFVQREIIQTALRGPPAYSI
jgi:hypothetical protein